MGSNATDHYGCDRAAVPDEVGEKRVLKTGNQTARPLISDTGNTLVDGDSKLRSFGVGVMHQS